MLKEMYPNNPIPTQSDDNYKFAITSNYAPVLDNSKIQSQLNIKFKSFKQTLSEQCDSLIKLGLV
jgi:hypothetical protein